MIELGFSGTEQNKWHLETRYHPDNPEELIAEHPNKIGTPRPATISNYALATLTAYIFFALQIHFLTISEGEDKVPIYILIGISVIWLLVSVFMWKRARNDGYPHFQHTFCCSRGRGISWTG